MPAAPAAAANRLIASNRLTVSAIVCVNKRRDARAPLAASSGTMGGVAPARTRNASVSSASPARIARPSPWTT
jgi:hypothetical protein